MTLEEIRERMDLFDKSMQSMMNHYVATNLAKLTDKSAVPLTMHKLFIGYEACRAEFMKNVKEKIPDYAWPKIINDMANESEGKASGKPRNFQS